MMPPRIRQGVQLIRRLAAGRYWLSPAVLSACCQAHSAAPRDGHRPRGWAEHLAATIDWIVRAHDASRDAGVPRSFDLCRRAWEGSYPETTGYIIVTLLRYAEMTGDEALRQRAMRMTEWEMDIQLPDGAVMSGTVDRPRVSPAVFNTGQVLLGWAEAYRRNPTDEMAEAMRRAADWLTAHQDADGAWRRKISAAALGGAVVYNTRTAWALVEVGRSLDEPRYLQAGRANVDWALAQQQPNGWFASNDLVDHARPLTHTIAYAIRGIERCGHLLNEPRYLDAAGRSAEAVRMQLAADGYLPGRLDAQWRPAAKYACLTGQAQMAVIFLALFERHGRPEWLEAARRCLRYVCGTQSLDTRFAPLRGAVAGSWPVWGEYCRFQYPNWAAKFLADALMAMLRLEHATECL
jgi:hypothetical protein